MTQVNYPNHSEYLKSLKKIDTGNYSSRFQDNYRIQRTDELKLVFNFPTPDSDPDRAREWGAWQVSEDGNLKPSGRTAEWVNAINKGMSGEHGPGGKEWALTYSIHIKAYLSAMISKSHILKNEMKKRRVARIDRLGLDQQAEVKGKHAIADWGSLEDNM